MAIVICAPSTQFNFLSEKQYTRTVFPDAHSLPDHWPLRAIRPGQPGCSVCLALGLMRSALLQKTRTSIRKYYDKPENYRLAIPERGVMVFFTSVEKVYSEFCSCTQLNWKYDINVARAYLFANNITQWRVHFVFCDLCFYRFYSVVCNLYF